MSNVKVQMLKRKESREKVQVEAKAKVKAGGLRLEAGGEISNDK